MWVECSFLEFIFRRPDWAFRPNLDFSFRSDLTKMFAIFLPFSYCFEDWGSRETILKDSKSVLRLKKVFIFTKKDFRLKFEVNYPNLRSKFQISGHNYKFEVKISNLKSLFKIWGQHSNLRSKFKFKVKIQIRGQNSNLRSLSKILCQNLKFEVKIRNLSSFSHIWGHDSKFEVKASSFRSKIFTHTWTHYCGY